MGRVPTVADLGAGEKEVLALGMQVPDIVMILDERLEQLDRFNSTFRQKRAWQYSSVREKAQDENPFERAILHCG